MKRRHFLLGLLAVIGALVAIYFILQSEHALVANPKGIIARAEFALLKTNLGLMLIVAIPTYILLFMTIFKYHEKNPEGRHDPEPSMSGKKQLLLWAIPSLIVLVMALITFDATHALDPYKPIESEKRPLKIQVVALDWKWLFIYPEQGIATVNFVQFPARTPVALSLAADGSPMNSFWLPELSGQIYAMTGMVTPLHLMADEPGLFAGRAAEINGEGLADMTFTAKSSTQEEFEAWVASVRQSPLSLTDSLYDKLAKPSQNHPVSLYAYVEKDLFDKIVMKYMHPHHAEK